MTLDAHLKAICAFNLWANTELVNWLKTKPLELMERETPSSFPTISDTLIHIWGAEAIWLERLQKVPTLPFLSFRFKGTVADVFEGILKNSAAFETYVNGLTEAELHEICPFKLLNGTEDSQMRLHMIQHCMNHSTYHRGQIVTMARNFGLTDPPGTDFIKYLRIQ